MLKMTVEAEKCDQNSDKTVKGGIIYNCKFCFFQHCGFRTLENFALLKQNI